MSQCLITRKSGKNRKYLFKDGVFSIQPTISKGSISNNKYTYTASGGGDTFLVIPYEANDEIIIIEINMTHCDYSYGHIAITNGGGTTCKYGAYAQGLDLIAGIPSSKELRLTNAYYQNDAYSISAIYTIPNKKVGGVIRQLITCLSNIFRKEVLA